MGGLHQEHIHVDIFHYKVKLYEGDRIAWRMTERGSVPPSACVRGPSVSPLRLSLMVDGACGR